MNNSIDFHALQIVNNRPSLTIQDQMLFELPDITCNTAIQVLRSFTPNQYVPTGSIRFRILFSSTYVTDGTGLNVGYNVIREGTNLTAFSWTPTNNSPMGAFIVNVTNCEDMSIEAAGEFVYSIVPSTITDDKEKLIYMAAYFIASSNQSLELQQLLNFMDEFSFGSDELKATINNLIVTTTTNLISYEDSPLLAMIPTPTSQFLQNSIQNVINGIVPAALDRESVQEVSLTLEEIEQIENETLTINEALDRYSLDRLIVPGDQILTDQINSIIAQNHSLKEPTEPPNLDPYRIIGRPDMVEP